MTPRVATDSDTIAAPATAQGEAAVAIVRISGPNAFQVVAKLAGDAWRPQPKRASLRRLTWRGRVLDQALLLPFKGPESFTGEDIVELHIHGGTQTLKLVLDAVLDAGARPAEPGEFTRRALMNDKLDLVQAEAIADIIHARGDAAHRLAQGHLAGELSAKVDAIKAAVARVAALVEAAIDFSAEEHVYTIGASEIAAGLEPAAASIAELIATYHEGRMRRDGVQVAIVGPPNAGKSSLLNALVGHDRAIVSSIAGTTRDYLEESVTVDGVVFCLVDTAGIRDAPSDEVEATGIARSRQVLQRADVAMLVLDVRDPAAAEPIASDVQEALSQGQLRAACAVVTHIDLAPDAAAPQFAHAMGCMLRIDLASTGAGGDARNALADLASRAGIRHDEDTLLLTRARHRDLLTGAHDALERAISAAEAELGHEFVALDIRAALDALGGLTGAVTSEDILRRIFSDFCVGK